MEGAGASGGPGCGARGRWRAWLRFETTHQSTRQHAKRCRCGGRRRDLPRCRWAAAGPGRASRRRAERSSRRGRLAGGPPPTGTHSGRAHRTESTAAGPSGARNTSGATQLALWDPMTAGPRKNSPNTAPSSGISAKKLAQRAIKRQFVAIFRALGELFRVSTSFAPRRANFFTLAHTPGQAGRKTSRTRRDNMARLKPTTPLLTPNKGPLKPTSPLHPKNAPDKPISRPQGRCRFHSHTDTSKQRR